MARIFEPFFTIKAQCVGIGLSIAHAIVEAHGGRIGAENVLSGAPLFTAACRLQSRNGDAVQGTRHANAFSSVAKITASDLSCRVTGGTGRSIFMS
ncbi:hypothetical protein [Bradyrhizobium sp. AC87j1]|uniref:hypothetical protein n=1 Tax=Bradyrhizobium sp. AC87j1 TaxID=2055894 RepID=UPI001FE06C04|nr:hypothetical protein [Bradyrhizobium sp. AC87j1]